MLMVDTHEPQGGAKQRGAGAVQLGEHGGLDRHVQRGGSGAEGSHVRAGNTANTTGSGA